MICNPSAKSIGIKTRARPMPRSVSGSSDMMPTMRRFRVRGTTENAASAGSTPPFVPLPMAGAAGHDVMGKDSDLPLGGLPAGTRSAYYITSSLPSSG